MAIHAGLHEGGVHLLGLVLLVGPRLQQETDHGQVALVAGQRQGRLLPAGEHGGDGVGDGVGWFVGRLVIGGFLKCGD